MNLNSIDNIKGNKRHKKNRLKAVLVFLILSYRGTEPCHSASESDLIGRLIFVEETSNAGTHIVSSVFP